MSGYIQNVKDSRGRIFNIRDPRFTDQAKFISEKDWTQNDSEKEDYIKNRTHYEYNHYELINPEWNGQFTEIPQEYQPDYQEFNISKEEELPFVLSSYCPKIYKAIGLSEMPEYTEDLSVQLFNTNGDRLNFEEGDIKEAFALPFETTEFSGYYEDYIINKIEAGNQGDSFTIIKVDEDIDFTLNEGIYFDFSYEDQGLEELSTIIINEVEYTLEGQYWPDMEGTYIYKKENGIQYQSYSPSVYYYYDREHNVKRLTTNQTALWIEDTEEGSYYYGSYHLTIANSLGGHEGYVFLTDENGEIGYPLPLKCVMVSGEQINYKVYKVSDNCFTTFEYPDPYKYSNFILYSKEEGKKESQELYENRIFSEYDVISGIDEPDNKGYIYTYGEKNLNNKDFQILHIKDSSTYQLIDGVQESELYLDSGIYGIYRSDKEINVIVDNTTKQLDNKFIQDVYDYIKQTTFDDKYVKLNSDEAQIIDSTIIVEGASIFDRAYISSMNENNRILTKTEILNYLNEKVDKTKFSLVETSEETNDFSNDIYINSQSVLGMIAELPTFTDLEEYREINNLNFILPNGSESENRAIFKQIYKDSVDENGENEYITKKILKEINTTTEIAVNAAHSKYTVEQLSALTGTLTYLGLPILNSIISNGNYYFSVFEKNETGTAQIVTRYSNNTKRITFSERDYILNKINNRQINTTNFIIAAEDIHYTAGVRPSENNDLVDKWYVDTHPGCLVPVVGSTNTITPQQVINAALFGHQVSISYTDEDYGTIIFTNFAVLTTSETCVSSVIINPIGGELTCLRLEGQGENWSFYADELSGTSTTPPNFEETIF